MKRGPDQLSMKTIRHERAGDASGIYAVHAQSFPSPGEARLVDLLRAAGRLAVSVLAEVDGCVVGHVAVSPVTTVGSGAVVVVSATGALAASRYAVRLRIAAAADAGPGDRPGSAGGCGGAIHAAL